MKSMIRAGVFALALSFVSTDVVVAQGKVVAGKGCAGQATFELCVKCNQERGAAGATGGHAWCSRMWKPRDSKKKN